MSDTWLTFEPTDWYGSTHAFPCVLVGPDGQVGLPCDPWTLPTDNDWSGWYCYAVPPLPDPRNSANCAVQQSAVSGKSEGDA